MKETSRRLQSDGHIGRAIANWHADCGLAEAAAAARYSRSLANQAWPSRRMNVQVLRKDRAVFRSIGLLFYFFAPAYSRLLPRCTCQAAANCWVSRRRSTCLAVPAPHWVYRQWSTDFSPAGGCFLRRDDRGCTGGIYDLRPRVFSVTLEVTLKENKNDEPQRVL